MKYRKLGQTGLHVSEIGFGGWGIGGTANGAPAYGPTDDQESKAALRRAFYLGVNFYDTSDFYGRGHSERVIGDTLKDVRGEVIIATKVGLLDANGSKDFSADHVKRSLRKSLERLQTDYIDLYQLHNLPMDVQDECQETVATLHSLRKEGYIRAFGVSVSSPDAGLIAVTKYGFGCIQVNFNLVDQRALQNGLFDLCREKGVGVIVRTPLCFGFLTGAYPPDSEFDASDHRSSWPPEQIKRWASAGRLFSSAVAGTQGQTEAQMALRYCLSYESVSTVIPGMLTEGQVDENLPASQMGPFSEAELCNIERIYRDNNFFVGR